MSKVRVATTVIAIIALIGVVVLACLYVDDDGTSIDGDLMVEGVRSGTVTTSHLDINGSGSVSATLDVGGKLTAVSELEITGGLDANGTSTFASASVFSGKLTSGAELEVTGGLDANGTATFAGTVTFSAYEQSEGFNFVASNTPFQLGPPTGWDVDSTSDWAIGFGNVPQECNQITAIVIYAGAVTGTLHYCDIDIYGGAHGEAYNIEIYSADDVASDGVVDANDKVKWTITDSGVCGAGGLSTGDAFRVAMIGSPGAEGTGPNGATDCRFQTIEVRYY